MTVIDSPANTKAKPAGVSRVGSLLPPGARAILALAAGGCRWPIGELDEAAFHFCNAVCLRRSYCPTHRRLAHRRATR